MMFAHAGRSRKRREASGLSLLLLAALLLAAPASALPLADFYPFNATHGDRATEKSDDGGSGEIAINASFPFFNRSHDKLYVNNNGVISFLRELTQYRPQDFPLQDETAIIAPFWADVDVKVGGAVWYRESQDSALLQLATDEIRKYFPDLRKFKANWIFVATWDNVGFYGAVGDGTNRRNTFQCVLITNGVQSFVIFNYNKIQWTTGSNSGGATGSGLGGNPAQVGFNAGDRVNFAKVEGARTDQVLNLTLTSNVGIAGKWVFRVDSAHIQGHCTQRGNGSISVWPPQGSMLGGNVVNVSGPCFSAGDEVQGRVEGTDVTFACHYVTDAMVSCVMEHAFVTGHVTLALNINGQGWNFTGPYNYINLAAYTPSVERRLPDKWVFGSNANVQVLWDPNLLLGASTCTVQVKAFAMVQDKPMFVSLTETARGIINNGRHNMKLPSTGTDLHAAIVQIKAEFNDTRPEPFIWSDVFPVRWESSSQSEAWCRNWSATAENATLEGALPCPCTARQAEGDTGRYQPDPACRADNSSPLNCLWRSPATECIVPNEGHSDVANSQCCYGDDKELINAQQDPAAGGVAQLLHFRSQSQKVVAYFSYFREEVLPRLHCCVFSSQACPLFLAKRPPTQCQGYDPPAAAQAAGDPHLVTVDGKEYTFNGQGDFVLVQDRARTVVVQVRAQRVPDINGTLQNATVFTNIAMRAGDNSARLEVRKASNSNEGIVETLVNGEVEDLDTPITELAGMTLKRTNAPNGTELTVVLEGTGMSILIRATRDLLNIMVMVGSETLKGQLEGLLGNYNGDPNDDFRSRDGKLLSSDASMRDLHHEFGMTWAVNSSESLLVPLPSGEVLPPMTPPFLDELPLNGSDLCGSNKQCLYDLGVTKNRDIAAATLIFTEFFQKRKDDVKQVVRCPFLDEPVYGNLTLEGRTNGSIAILQCVQDYVIAGNKPEDTTFTLQCFSNGSWVPPSLPACVKATDPSEGNKFESTIIIISTGVVGGAAVLLIVVIVIVLLCKRRKKKIYDGGREDIDLPNIFPPSDIPKPVFENPSFLHSLSRLSESGPFKIPRPTFVDPSIYTEYF